MAWELPLFRVPSFVAGEDLTDEQYKFVTLDTDGDVVLADEEDDVVGVLQNEPSEGQSAQILVAGVTKLKVLEDEDIDYLEGVATADNGYAQKADPSDPDVDDNYIVGKSYDSVTDADGTIITVAINCLNVGYVDGSA